MLKLDQKFTISVLFLPGFCLIVGIHLLLKYLFDFNILNVDNNAVINSFWVILCSIISGYLIREVLSISTVKKYFYNTALAYKYVHKKMNQENVQKEKLEIFFKAYKSIFKSDSVFWPSKKDKKKYLAKSRVYEYHFDNVQHYLSREVGIPYIEDLKIGTQFLEGIILSLRVITFLYFASFVVDGICYNYNCDCLGYFQDAKHYELLFYALSTLILSLILSSRYKKLKNSYYNGLFEAFVEKNMDDARFNKNGDKTE